MRFAGKILAVTGGGSGIGAALCHRFAEEGAAAIAVIDLDASCAAQVAEQISASSVGKAAGGTAAIAVGCDATSESELVAAIDRVEQELGPIDLFCSNAGVLVNDPDFDDPASGPDMGWETSWRLHVMSHVWAARRLAPGMAKRGGGYFLNTVSAAGLLTQLGSGPYSATKHAAIGFAESLAIAYADRGVKVSVLCPQGVATPMVAAAAHTPAVADGLLSPDYVADVVIDGLAQERFLILPHPQVLDYLQRKAGDYDRWLRGMTRLRQASAV